MEYAVVNSALVQRSTVYHLIKEMHPEYTMEDVETFSSTPRFSLSLLAFGREDVARNAFYNFMRRGGHLSPDDPVMRNEDWHSAVADRGKPIAALLCEQTPVGVCIHAMGVQKNYEYATSFLLDGLADRLGKYRTNAMWTLVEPYINENKGQLYKDYGFKASPDLRGRVVVMSKTFHPSNC